MKIETIFPDPYQGNQKVILHVIAHEPTRVLDFTPAGTHAIFKTKRKLTIGFTRENHWGEWSTFSFAISHEQAVSLLEYLQANYKPSGNR